MWRKFCGFLLKAWGWTPDGGTAPEDKCILLGAPHTSIWDFVVAYLFYQAVGGDALCMVKQEMFKWPLGPIIRKMGGIPVNKKNPSAIVLSVIREMEKREKAACQKMEGRLPHYCKGNRSACISLLFRLGDETRRHQVQVRTDGRRKG